MRSSNPSSPSYCLGCWTSLDEIFAGNLNASVQAVKQGEPRRAEGQIRGMH